MYNIIKNYQICYFFIIFARKYCGVEQLVAYESHNLVVAGSSPAPATTTI